MALLGTGAVAMWWDIAPGARREFEDWHTHEHFPERMGIPGFRRGSRWSAADGGEGFFVLYELEAHGILSSDAYLERLNAPTPWSARMMPHHRNMVRSQCHVLASEGAALSRCLLTLRLEPAAGREAALEEHLAGSIPRLAVRPGIASAHLLRHHAPDIAATTEQRIRGADAAADWIFLAGGYDRRALEALREEDLSDGTLQGAGARAGARGDFFHLSHSTMSGDLD